MVTREFKDAVLEILRDTPDKYRQVEMLPIRKSKDSVPEGAISLSEASRISGIHAWTLSRWATRHQVPVLLETPNAKYVDKSALFTIIERYKQNPGQGKRTL